MEYDYFDLLKEKLEVAYSVASEAKSKGFDPEKEVEIKIAKDVAGNLSFLTQELMTGKCLKML